VTDNLPPDRARATPIWLRVALGVSLALNLAVLGIVLGSVGRDRMDDMRSHGGAEMQGAEGMRWGGRTPRGSESAMALSPYVAALPAQDRRAIGREVFGQARSEGIGLRELRASVEAVIVALRAEPFTPDTVATELARQRTALSRVQEVSQAALLERLQVMSVEERRAFADRLEAGLRRRGGPVVGQANDDPAN
jgi:uncharacterized membrane protein